MKRLEAIHLSLFLRQQVTIHLLHTPHSRSYTSNALLNLARLFASTKQVLLFPLGLSRSPQPTLRTALLITPRSEPYPYRLIPANATISLPGNPLSSDSVLLIDRDAPFWCSERFFAAPDLIAEWDECLWQVWLAAGSTLSDGPGLEGGWAMGDPSGSSSGTVRTKRDRTSVYVSLVKPSFKD